MAKFTSAVMNTIVCNGYRVSKSIGGSVNYFWVCSFEIVMCQNTAHLIRIGGNNADNLICVHECLVSYTDNRKYHTLVAYRIKFSGTSHFYILIFFTFSTYLRIGAVFFPLMFSWKLKKSFLNTFIHIFNMHSKWRRSNSNGKGMNMKGYEQNFWVPQFVY